MSDEFPKPAEGTASDSLFGQQGVGPTLRTLREARQLTPAEVCMRLKFSQRQLNALESEQWDRLPQGTPLRGFVKNYARYLDADVEAMLSMLDAQVGPPKSAFVSSDGGSQLGASDLPVSDDMPRRPWGWLLVILVLVFVALVYAARQGLIPDSWLVFDWLRSLK